MKKRLSKLIAAAACAVMMASQMAVFNVAAADPTGTHYYYYNGIFYSYDSDATSAAGGNAGAWTAVPADRIPSNATKKFYDPATKMIYETEAAAEAAGVSNIRVIYVGTYTAVPSGYGRWYSSYTGRTYSTYEAALEASKGIASYVTYIGDYGYGYGYSYGRWYSSYTGKTYATYQEALYASMGISSYVTYVSGNYGYDGAAGSIYRYIYNGVAYPSLEAAIAAGGTALGVDIYYTNVGTTGSTTYYYYYNGTYYGSLQAAINAGGTAVGVDISYVPYGYYGKNYGYTNYYYNPYYYSNGYLMDPYALFRNNIFSTNKVTTESKTAEPGEPFIYGNNKKAGWDTIVTYVKAASAGTNIKVNMNGCNVIDKSVISALSGRNVSVTFVMESGVKWTINGKKVSKAQDIICYTEYDIDYISPSLVKKASADAVTKAQIGVSTNFEEFGSDVSVTVRFSDKRAGLNATVYLYNPDTNSLKGVSKAKVQADGSCTFTAKAGGPYLIVLK